MERRDVQLDCYRALSMMYIVCIIHPVLWYRLSVYGFDPTMLFEMPVIFYIAGASQTYTRRRSMMQTISNRAWRVLIPYYIFIGAMLLLMGVATLLHLTFENQRIDIMQIGTTGIAKLLLTGGSAQIPYLGYTWFISTYFIIACSLPVQQRIMQYIPPKYYLLLTFACFALWKATGINSPENIVENVLSYNCFYMLGYISYKKMKTHPVVLALAAAMCVYLVVSDTALPMGEHKFPSDMIFVIYSLCTLYMLAFVLNRISISDNALTRLWNQRGYTIYLYQSVSHYMVYKVLEQWLSSTCSSLLLLIVSAVMVFIASTALSFITFPLEKYIINHLQPHHQKI